MVEMWEMRKLKDLRFVAEQDGPPERIFKRSLTTLFRHHTTVRRAYLVQVEYDSSVAVALCLVAARDDENIGARVAELFASQFRANQHLDIVVLSEAQEHSVSQVCRPFFVSEP